VRESFTISFQGDPGQLVNRAKQAAAQHHVQFDGDEHSGNFSGDGVAGTYKIEDHTVTVTINRKPFYVTMGMIRDHLTQFFAA
jgi:hypothetical protein